MDVDQDRSTSIFGVPKLAIREIRSTDAGRIIVEKAMQEIDQIPQNRTHEYHGGNNTYGTKDWLTY